MSYSSRSFILILLILSITITYFYHEAVLNTDQFQKKYWINLPIKNDYKHFFYMQNIDPIYIFKNKLLDKYSKYSFQYNKHWLVYPHQQLIADLKYIWDIQYASSVQNPYQAKYLYNDLNYITNLSPFWTEIYNIWLLILPAPKNAKWLNWIEMLSNRRKTISLWEKGIFFNCNKKKIENILSLKDEEYFHLAYSKTWTLYKQNVNPCKTIDIPEQLWFDYFYYLKDLENTIKYYKIAWFMKNALDWIIWMVAVANGMLWEHEKGMYLLMQKAINIYEKLNKSQTDKEIKFLSDILNSTIQRAQEELNFYIISQADNLWKECNKNYICLVNKWYIQKVIDKLKNECSNEFDLNQIKSFEDIFSKNIQNSLKNSKCFLLWVSIQNWYIKKWQLKTILIKNWTYFYDHENQIWWIKNN